MANQNWSNPPHKELITSLLKDTLKSTREESTYIALKEVAQIIKETYAEEDVIALIKELKNYE